ncbi:ABC transporter permease [Streptomyces sp. CA-111067]|uniref:ABC transporter permease n=1 Tax=Streptomyces sp. CA-111067 TaxID=3240046 RepID=UPI003D9532F8
MSAASQTGSRNVSAGPTPTRQARPRRTGKETWAAVRPFVLGSLSLVLLIALWQVAVNGHWVKPLFLPGPSKVVHALGSLFSQGEIWSNLRVSGEEFALGLGISVVLGAVLGLLTGWYKAVDEFLKPLVVGINSMPQVAVVPVLILIFGIGMTPKIVVVVLSCTTVILMNTAAGVANVDWQLRRLARSFGASDPQVIRTIVLPSLVPFFMTGLRISIGRAMIGVVVGEIFASKAGIGNVLISASNSFNMPVMYATVAIITFLGIALTQVAALLERRMQRWRR